MKARTKKWTAVMAAAAMTLGMGMTAQAADTTDVTSTDSTTTQEGEVWATIKGEPLKQLKVTLPIRLDFAVYKDTAQNTNKFKAGDYEVKVASDSETGVKLEGVEVSSAAGGKWTLKASADMAASTDARDISLGLGGKELAYGKNELTGFTVGIGAKKSLGLTGTPSQSPISVSESGNAEKAFQVIYTVSQVK